MGQKPRTFDNDGKGNDKLKALRKLIKEQEREITRLKQELKTLNKAFEKSAAYMSSQSKDLTVEELINAANKEHNLAEAKAEKAAEDAKKPKFAPPSQEELEKARQETLERIRKWREETYGKYEEEV